VLYTNVFSSGGDKYKSSTKASKFEYDTDSGSFKWYTAPSGTAGNAISFTQAMTLDASGNLVIGATSANAPLDVTQKTSDTANGLTLRGYTTGADGGRTFNINTVSSDLNNWANLNLKAQQFTFSIQGTERARIDTSGNLLVGTTSSNARFTAQQSGSNDVMRANIGSGGAAFLAVGSASEMTAAYFITNGSAYAGAITCLNTTTSYLTASDYRLKEDIQPMTGALAKVSALKPVTYTWKADGSAGEGFIAHELAEVCPHAVIGEKDAVDADGNPQYQGIDVSFLVGTLTAAIQELKAEFDAYKATHP
jgi:hypothetical protein